MRKRIQIKLRLRGYKEKQYLSICKLGTKANMKKQEKKTNKRTVCTEKTKQNRMLYKSR